MNLRASEDEKPTWTGFEHRLKADLEDSGLSHKLVGKRVCVALSGGVDSVGLLLAMKRLSHSLKIDVQAAHFHHGSSQNKAYRDSCFELCKLKSQELNVDFFSEIHEGLDLNSEAEFREARWKFLRKLIIDNKTDFIATAHHSEDQLETRLLKLIRGCGISGLVSMQQDDEEIVRPFLLFNKNEIEQFVNEIGSEFIVDPTNSDNKYYRNWLRNEWLPQLEAHQAGSIKNLARSLETIAESFKQQNRVTIAIWYQGQWEKGLDRLAFHALNKSEQRQVLVTYLKKLGKHDFRHTQVDEIIKNLDSNQIIHRFNLLQLRWQLNAEQILALN